VPTTHISTITGGGGPILVTIAGGGGHGGPGAGEEEEIEEVIGKRRWHDHPDEEDCGVFLGRLRCSHLQQFVSTLNA